MSVWNEVLQALHSSLIDELNAQFPEEKLELGLPKRLSGWGPSPHAESLLLRKLETKEGRGVVALGFLASQDPQSTKDLWEATIARSIREFSIRKILANYGDPIELPPPLGMTIWLPIRIPTLAGAPVYDLGVAV